jgi:hypothetical protein
MSDTVICIEHLSKLYTIRHGRNGDNGLRHAIHDLASAPFGWLRRQHGAWSKEHGATPSDSSSKLLAPSSMLFNG